MADANSAQPLRSRGPRGRGLRRRILLWFLVLSLVPLFVSNTVGYIVTRRIIEEQVRRYLIGIAQVQVQHIASEIHRNQLYLDALVAGDRFLARSIPAAAAAARDGQRRTPALAGLHEYLDRKLAELRSLTSLSLVDHTGLVVASTEQILIGSDWSAVEWFRVARDARVGGESRSTPQSPADAGYLLAAPIRDAADRGIGVLAAGVALERLPSLLRLPPHVARDVHAYVVDRRGFPLIVPHPHRAFEYGKPFPSPLTNQPAGSVARYVNYESIDVLATSVPVPGLPWLYIAEQPAATALGQLRSLALLAAALEMAFALALVAVVWRVARSIVAPLRRLVAAAERIRGGELGVEVDIDRDDELGELGRTFNQMSGELRSSAQRIGELHEQEMRRAGQLASVGELASGIAHEIKTPLAGLTSGIDLLAEQLPRDGQTDGLVSKIRVQLRRMESAIHDLLSYARPKEPRLIVADPRDLVRRVTTLVGPQADAAGVRIETRLAGTPAKLRVDPELMTQALVNLALNGIQAMDPGGVLTLAAESVDGETRIAIADSGPGLTEAQLERIFRPFYTTKLQGTGLGLAITRGIVERHGGRVAVNSRPGRGSTFTIIFSAPGKEPTAP